MILYLDSSAFLKLYVDEPESAAVRAAVEAAQAVFVHLIGYAELRAALAKAVRMGRLPESELAYQVARLDCDWDTVRVVGVDEAMVRRAGELAQTYGLRGYDSLHLAAAEAIRLAAPGLHYRIGVYDVRLADAARHLGMRVLG